jgi:DNA-binding GntR family transcriptional regulator
MADTTETKPGRGSGPVVADEATGRPLVSAVERVIQEIKSGVREGRYAPGQRLVEPALTEALGVSRGSVREAFHRLDAEGLIQLAPYRGASVRRMSRTDVAELHQIREVLEGHAAAEAALHLDDADRSEIEELERLWDAGTEFPSYNEYNEQFHNLIMRIGRNAHVPHFVQQTKLAIIRLQFQYMLIQPRHTERSRGEHREVIEAIFRNDAKAAEERMRRHIRGSTTVILSAPDHYFS